MDSIETLGNWRNNRGMQVVALLLCLSVIEPSPAETPKASTALQPVHQASWLPREDIEWCDLWLPNCNKDDLPRVLLIGDSITRAYSDQVERELAGTAYVGRLATSAFASDPMLLAEVGMVLDGPRFDVIHLNNGMHGWQHSEAEYRDALPKLLALIRKRAPHAKLIWASTTPIRIDGTGPAQASDARIQARNRDAMNCVKSALGQRSFWVDDLYTLMTGHPEMHSDNVHFGAEGVKLQAQQVAQVIRDALKAP